MENVLKKVTLLGSIIATLSFTPSLAKTYYTYSNHHSTKTFKINLAQKTNRLTLPKHKGYTWTSSNSKQISVNKYGIITYRKYSTKPVKITATKKSTKYHKIYRYVYTIKPSYKTYSISELDKIVLKKCCNKWVSASRPYGNDYFYAYVNGIKQRMYVYKLRVKEVGQTEGNGVPIWICISNKTCTFKYYDIYTHSIDYSIEWDGPK